MTAILAQAKRFESPLVKTSDNFFDEIRDLHSGKSESRGLPTGWQALDNLLRGIRSTELTVLTGETGSGKSTWAANLAYHLAIGGDIE
jgi:replicative DNA helicase